MQTFLPDPLFSVSAHCLDRQRLGKQRVEVVQILRALAGDTKGWSNHPATRMWSGHEHALAQYGRAVCGEWISRGYRDTCLQTIEVYANRFKDTGNPKWVGSVEFHRAHQSNLVRKFPEHYRKFFPDVPSDLPYVWPTETIAKHT
jgi:hypothetical protein